MVKPNRYFDIVVLILLCYTAGVAIYYHIKDIASLSISNYVGFVLLIAVTITKFINRDKFKLSVLFLLFLGVFNVVSFTFFRVSAAVGYGNNIESAEIINPLILVLLIVYVIINRRFIKSYYTKNDKEVIENENKLFGFYYDKFSACNGQELEEAFSMFKHYPEEAQIALKKIHKERKLNFKFE